MEIVRRVHSMKETARQLRAKSRKIGFVPTMGALHEGHLALVHRVKELADVTVVSIFVNPTQFGPGEDFERYPRDLAGDADVLIAEGVDYLFAPDPPDVYPEGPRTYVEVQDLSTRLEGASRPGHFRGVTTVVLKLFEIVHPTVAAFGQKDAQQAVIIQRMVEDLMLDVEILVLPTVRDSDGLAKSSRNAYLSEAERAAARAVPRALELGESLVAEGERDAEIVVRKVRARLEEEALIRVDYVALVDSRHLEPPVEIAGETFLLVAVFVGRTRLLDNVLIRV